MKQEFDYNEFDKNFPLGESFELPCIPARDVVVLPGEETNIDVARRRTVYSVKRALKNDGYVFITMQKDSLEEKPSAADLCHVGTIAYVKQAVETNGSVYRCYIIGCARAELEEFSAVGAGFSATARRVLDYEEDPLNEHQIQAIMHEVLDSFSELLDAMNKPLSDEERAVFAIRDPYELYETLVQLPNISPVNRQELHELPSCGEKLMKLAEVLASEADIVRLEAQVHAKVHESINQGQRDYYIREQIRVLKEELGEDDDYQSDSEECAAYREKLAAVHNISDDARARLAEEIERLAKTPSYSQEAALLRSYLDVCLSLPWDTTSEDVTDIDSAAKILDEDHYGIRKVKDRILENIAVRELTPDVKGQIICLSGPPGVGKTSVAKSIARALGRKFVRVSLGGVRDESDIRGHRKTYLGAMPGRIIMALKQAGTSNPVMLLDEIDKMANDFRGDPSSAMLEVLDSEQNSQFRDHYTEIPFDLSNVLFITTANNTSAISAPLLDRMELIELSSYTREEKFHIAKEHLLPKQLKKHGIKASQLRLADSAIYSLIDSYTREAGVRTLEREIGSLCRKSAKKLVTGEKKVSIKAANIEEYLGHKKFTDDYFSKKPAVGCVNGLAWTSVGGVILPVEALILDGKGKVTLTGSLGDVMKESATLAVSNARRLAKAYGYDADFYEKKDIHIHAPEGAVPKDGPSAGVTMITALVSALSGIKVRSDVAMTGEITLTGKVLPIGGLREKTMAAYKAGMQTVIIPQGNKGDLDDVDEKVREEVQFVLADKIEDVLAVALMAGEKSGADEKPKKRKPRAKRSEHTEPAEPTEAAETGRA